MKKIIHPIRYRQVRYYPGLILLFIIICASQTFAGDFENKGSQDLVFSATILAVSANISSERMSISYNGLPSGRGILFQSDNNEELDPLDLSDTILNEVDGEKQSFKFGRKLKQMTRYFLKYFNVDDLSTDDEDVDLLLKGKVNVDPIPMDPENQNNFGFNLSFNVGYDNDTILKMNAIKIESYLYHTFVNAVYHPEENEFELGLSSAYINAYLLDGMKLEFQANPGAGSGALLFVMNL